MSTKQELSERLNTLAALKAKLEEMSLSADELNILRELLSDEEERASRRWLRAQAEQAVSLLFPSWRGARVEEARRPRRGGQAPAMAREDLVVEWREHQVFR